MMADCLAPYEAFLKKLQGAEAAPALEPAAIEEVTNDNQPE
jgi:hypothetical protein